MKTFLITYDLHKPGQNYADLHEKIKSLGSWWHCVESNWIVKSNSTAVNIRNSLKPYIDSNDELIVAQLDGESAWTGFKDKCSTWLQQNM